MGKSKTLVITNGSVAAALLKINKAADVYLSWDDILHEGPVPYCSSLQELSSIRAKFLERRYSSPDGGTTAVFKDRDDMIGRHSEFDRIELWFEHDLYDQLQLIQILDQFAGFNLTAGKLSLIQSDRYLGEQLPENIMGLRELCAPVTAAQLSAGELAWRAFRQPAPVTWATLINVDASTLPCLPWLQPAIIRMLEELPSAHNGLTRTEAGFIEILARKTWPAGRGIGQYLADQPEPRFIGDWTLFNLLTEWMRLPTPLIEPIAGDWTGHDQEKRKQFMKSKVVLTPLAHELIAGKADQIAVNGIDRWWGGTHLTTDNCWRWDSAARQLVAPLPTNA